MAFGQLVRSWLPPWLIALLIIKLAAQMIAAGQYGFHRDEFLYLVQAEHLAWGYFEVPPLIAWLGACIRAFSDNIYWVKLFPAMGGMVMMIFVAAMTRELGGKTWAQFLAVLAVLMVPAYLRNHHLFQPVFLNQLAWVILFYFVIRLRSTGSGKYWYFIGLTIGIGALIKYSIVFPVAALGIALLLTSERKWFARKELYVGALMALLIALPNILWQYNHNFPVLAHMAELRQTQLVNVDPLGFLVSQPMMLFASTLVWLPGLLALLFWKNLAKYRLIGLMYLTVLTLLLVLSGKDYYVLGAYPVLMAAGGSWWEFRLRQLSVGKVALPFAVILLNLPAAPYGIPILPIEKMMGYASWMDEHIGFDEPLYWEDGRKRALPQDYADMHGWEEMAQRTAAFYNALPSADRERCNIWGGSYSHASTLTFYRHKYNLPEVHSFVGSHVFWVPQEADFNAQLIVDDVWNLESQSFANVQFVDSIQNKFARERGYIFYRTDPLVDVPSEWRKLVQEQRGQWQRK